MQHPVTAAKICQLSNTVERYGDAMLASTDKVQHRQRILSVLMPNAVSQLFNTDNNATVQKEHHEPDHHDHEHEASDQHRHLERIVPDLDSLLRYLDLIVDHPPLSEATLVNDVSASTDLLTD